MSSQHGVLFMVIARMAEALQAGLRELISEAIRMWHSIGVCA